MNARYFGICRHSCWKTNTNFTDARMWVDWTYILFFKEIKNKLLCLEKNQLCSIIEENYEKLKSG